MKEAYFNLGVTIHNKEIILSSYYNNIENNNTIIFYNNNNSNELKTLNKINNIYCHQNAEFSYLSVKIINKQDDYYVLICCEIYCNLINYNNNEILNFQPHDSSILKTLNRNSLITLDNYNYFYIIVTGSGIKDENHLSISKFYFSFNEVNNSIEVNLENKYYSQEIINRNTIIACFQTENKIIECMTFNNDNYLYIYIFDESLNLKDKIILDTNSMFTELFNCFHLQKEIGIYYYYYEVNGKYIPELKIKNLIYNEDQNEYQLVDVLNCSNTNIIDINASYFDNLDILKITNTKIIIMYNTIIEEFHVILCDLYGKNDSLTNLIARYYKIPFELYNIDQPLNPKGFKYENIIGLSMIDSNFFFIILFGYNNISQSFNIENININNNDNLYYIINLNDYLSNNIKINNNLFGYELIRLKISAITGISYGIKYYVNTINNNNIIKENDMVNISDVIIIDFSNAEVKIDNELYLEITQIIGEPEYDKFNSYADEIKVYGNEDQKNYFQRYIFEGSSFKIRYTFGCYKNCDNCEYAGFTLDNQKCLSCKKNEELCYMKNENNCFNINILTYNYYKEDGNLICVPLNSLCPEDYPFENKITKECTKILNFDDLILEKYIYTNTKNAIDKVVQLIYEEIKNNKLNISANFLINNDGTIFQITTPENQQYYINNSLYNNISSIDLNECADILKKENNIKEPLIIVKLDIKRNDTPSTQVEYEVYNPYNLQKLNLSVCDNINIDIYAPVVFDKDYLELIKHLKEQGYDIFNPEDSFYNDICSTYNSQNNTDVIIKDRKNDFYNPNLFLCEDTCEYKSFDINASKVNCKCNVKQQINSNIYETKFSPNTLLNNFFDFDRYTNYKVLKCYNMVFNLERIKINKGSYIVFFLIISFVTYMTINFCIQNDQYRKILDDIIYINKITDKKLKIKRENNDNNENNENNNSYGLKDSNINIKKENLNPVEGIIKRRKYKLKTITSNNKDKHIKFLINNKDIDNKENKKIYLRRNKSNKNVTHFDITDKKKKLPTLYDCDNDDINRNTIFRKTKKSSNESNDTNIFSRSSRKQIFNHANSNEKINNSKNRLRFSHRIKKPKKNVSFFNDIIYKNKNATEQTLFFNERINKIIEIIPKNERYVYFIDNELNELDYIYAINIDFRTLFQYYWSLLKQIHPLFFTFIAKHDYNLFFIKLSLFVFSIALNITLNTLFFSDESMHKLYEDYGKLNYIYNLPKSLYSVLFSGLISFFFELLSLSENDLSKFKEKGVIKDFDKEKKEQIKHLKLKSILFFIIGTSLLIFFWYYISCFCAVYSNAQMSLIKDTFISFIIELTYPFLFALISTIIRIQALRKKSRCLYNFSKIVAFIINLI